ncbi:MAG: DNA repair protein RecN, partial [Candidatus Krumholzibacteria bacterium]|nr:DNA repair protein RecN [Candidatus Krumholzibacteria bacterium]
VTISFSDGLNVMTGATGAGKSIILTAVDLLSGSRGNKALLRKGAETLVVEGIFSVFPGWSLRAETGMSEDEELLSVRREISSSGKSRIWINGRSATNNLARLLTSSLLELHGQRRRQELLNPSNHLKYLDLAGNYTDLMEKVETLSARFRKSWKRLSELIKEEDRNREQEDYFRFQLTELEALQLEDGLDQHLESKIRKIENIQRFNSSLEKSIQNLMEDDGSVIDRLFSVEKEMDYLGRLDPGFQEISSRLADIRISLQEISRDLEKESADEDSPRDLHELQQLLASIQRAQRKYGLDNAGLIQKREELEKVLTSLMEGSSDMMSIRVELDDIKALLIPALEALSRSRNEFAAKLDKAVTAELNELGMEGSVFRTRVDRREIKAFLNDFDELDLSTGGWDDVEFLIRTNVGEEIHPLADVASGGELSRVTLVLKNLLVREKSIPTLVFDEVDSGLGADLGRVIAEKMKELSENFQIICITHLPQVAAAGKQHVLISKEVRNGRTSSSARVLSRDERKTELSRMLGGGSGLSKKLASELLNDGTSARSSAG